MFAFKKYKQVLLLSYTTVKALNNITTNIISHSICSRELQMKKIYLILESQIVVLELYCRMVNVISMEDTIV